MWNRRGDVVEKKGGKSDCPEESQEGAQRRVGPSTACPGPGGCSGNNSSKLLSHRLWNLGDETTVYQGNHNNLLSP